MREEEKKTLVNWMRICVLLVLRLQGISGDEIQRPGTLAVNPRAHWKIPVMDTRDCL